MRDRGGQRRDACRTRSRPEGRDDGGRCPQSRRGVRSRAGRLGSLATGIVETAGVDPKAGAQAVVEGATLGSYSFGKFKSDAPKKSVESFTLITPERAVKATEAGVDRGTAIAEAVAMARDLVNTPGGSLNARDMAEVALQVAKESGLAVEVMDEDAMEKAGMGGMLGVNKGSDEPPRLIKMTYSPRNPSGSVALVGKGIMFDSGGLSLKSGEGMMSMKIDMSGAAAVLATMSALKTTKPKVKVVAFLCCTDNMPSGTALKPGDVITIRNGKTVEVLNTDAEGRLVLADGLSLAVEEKVDAIVDLATLTGAVVAALGNRIAGVMGNDDDWMGQVRSAAARADENVLAASASHRVPALPRLTGRRHEEHRRHVGPRVGRWRRWSAHRGPVPEGVRRRHPVGAHRPRGPAMADSDDSYVSRAARGSASARSSSCSTVSPSQRVPRRRPLASRPCASFAASTRASRSATLWGVDERGSASPAPNIGRPPEEGRRPTTVRPRRA